MMKKLTVYSLVLDNRKNCTDYTDPEYKTVLYAMDCDQNLYSNWGREDLDLFEELDIISASVVAEFDFSTWVLFDGLNKATIADLSETILSNSFGLSKVEGHRSVYERVQHYGGAEEGGWYYHNLVLTGLSPEDVELGTNRYGEGYELRIEPIRGMFEDTTKPHYC
jgi:hypothetical protein